MLWLGSGLRRVDPERYLAVLDGPLPGAPYRVGGTWALAPPGWLRLRLYPSAPVRLPLPDAEALGLRAADGSRFGLNGWVTLRAEPQQWRELHAAAGEEGLAGALTAVIREVAFEPRAPTRDGSLQPDELDRFAADLEAGLARRGLAIESLEIDSLDVLTAASGEAPLVDSRLLVIGLDGLDWAIADPLLASGRMPNLRALVERGCRAKLLSISPMLSPVVWTTVATGVEPTRHGVLDFVVAEADGSGAQPVTSAQRRVPAVWEILSRVGVGVGVVGWWASWPAEPVRGYLVTDRLAYQLFGFEADPDDARGKTWPPELYAEIRPLVAEPAEIAEERVAAYLRGGRRRFAREEAERLESFRTLLASGDTYLGVARHLAERFDPQLELVYFEGTDTVAHLFMPFRPPPVPGVDPRSAESFAEVVDRYYETADGFIGRLLEGRGAEWNVMVLSDHGFASDATRPHTTDSRIGHGAAADWHRRFGVLVVSGPAFRPGHRIAEASVYDIAPTILALFGQPVPKSWPGRALGEALTDAFLEAHPVRYAREDPAREGRAEGVGTDPGAADLMAKLRSLGYVSAAGEGNERLTARNNAGVSLLAEGRLAEAEAEFRAAIEENPGAAMPRINLGLALGQQGRTAEAARIFEEVIEQQGGLRIAGTQLALLHLDAGDLDAAERLVRRVLAAEPEAAEAHNVLGRVLETRGDASAAEREFEEAARLDPHAAAARTNLGNLLGARGDLEGAKAWHLRAIEADPYFMGAYNNLALVYQRLGQMDRAIDLYHRALGKAPRDAIVLNNLASLYFATGDTGQASETWRRAVAADPNYASPLNNLAGLAIAAGRLDEAEQLLERALALDPAYGDARINLALVHGRRGDLDAAGAELRKAVEDRRSWPTAWVHLARYELERGRPGAAVEALERAMSGTEGDVEALNLLGQAQLRAGRAGAAAQAWQRSLALRPDQPGVEAALKRLTSIGVATESP